MVKLKLKDGSIMEVEKGSSILDVAKKISEGLARIATCGEINGKVEDLRYEINEDCELVIHTFQDDDLEGKKAYWHTTSHIMAQAIKRLYGDVKLTIGPAIENGFYYDFDTEKHFSEEDFEKIEEEMKKIIKEANNAGVPCSVCGEMASSPLDAMALIGLGFRNLSVSSASYGKVKAMIRSLSARGVEDYLNNILSSSRRTLRPQLKSYAADHAIEIY